MTPSTPPIVSVIVPAFNAAWSLAETLDSVTSQSLTRWECVIVDDGSNDGTGAVAAEYARRDPRFRTVRQENRGLAGARNTGLDLARGELIHFLDSDDRLMPWALGALADRLHTLGADAVFARHEWRDTAGRPLGWAPMLDRFTIGHAELLHGCPFPVISQMIRRDAIGGTRFDPSLRIGEDWDFWLRLSERAVTWHGFDTLVAAYRVSPASLSRDAAAMWRSLSRSALAAHARAGTDADCRRGLARELALEYATAALATDASLDGALALLQQAAEDEPLYGSIGELSPAQAAAKVFHRLSWSLGMSPERWAQAPAGPLATALAFWERLELVGAAAPGFHDAALRSLADLAATPALTAARLAESLAPAPVTIFGLGRNARYLAGELTRRGITFTGSDDSLAAAPGWAADLGLNFPVVAPSQALREHQAVLTMGDDSHVLERPWSASPLRWKLVHAALADEIYGRFLGALDRRAKGSPVTPGV